jgi:hypothetical protein
MVRTRVAVLVTSSSPHALTRNRIFTSTFVSLNLLRYQGRVSFARMARSALAPSLVFVALPEAQLRIVAWSS